jgi:hypothetical protein
MSDGHEYEDIEPIPVNEPWEGYRDSIPEGAPAWNRAPGRTAADVNLDGAPFGFRVTGDAAWDSGSHDYAMFTEAGNLAVAAMVSTARLKTRSEEDAAVLIWIEGEKARIANDPGTYPYLPKHQDTAGQRVKTGHSEVYDTMVRETIAYALDEAWEQAYGHRFGEAGPWWDEA